ncbi:hypothetical protein GCM10023322_11650 [Rugosimonospora acidiphila]|uniref:Alpha/beta hydrolase n=1 Tax=Rugosimonospora acidiphila TaxID=556531 RepID=A0ABP9RLE3_9ACTN
MTNLPVRRVITDVLGVAYHEAGPADGQPIILLHGYPYDIHSYVEVAPLLAKSGYRVPVAGRFSTPFCAAWPGCDRATSKESSRDEGFPGETPELSPQGTLSGDTPV